MKTISSRKKLILILGPFIGIWIALIFWVWKINQHPVGPTDAMAKQMGFRSANRYDAIMELDKHKTRSYNFTNAQFNLVQDVLLHDSDKSKMGAIISMCGLKEQVQQERAIRLMEPYIGDTKIYPVIYVVLNDYNAENHFMVINLLSHSSNPYARNAASLFSKPN